MLWLAILERFSTVRRQISLSPDLVDDFNQICSCTSFMGKLALETLLKRSEIIRIESSFVQSRFGLTATWIGWAFVLKRNWNLKARGLKCQSEITETYWDILRHTETYWDILRHTETYWDILRPFTTPPHVSYIYIRVIIYIIYWCKHLWSMALLKFHQDSQPELSEVGAFIPAARWRWPWGSESQFSAGRTENEWNSPLVKTNGLRTGTWPLSSLIYPWNMVIFHVVFVCLPGRVNVDIQSVWDWTRTPWSTYSPRFAWGGRPHRRFISVRERG